MRKKYGLDGSWTFRFLLFIVIASPMMVLILQISDRVLSPKKDVSPELNGGGLRRTTSLTVHEVKKKKKIAYAITVTKDGPFLDGALVLGHAARKVHDLSRGFSSRYDAELVAIVAPSVTTSRDTLAAYGWKILERALPVQIDEIVNKDYAENMRKSGCCGADEFLKLWAYTLTEYHRVVHLDMDSIIFKNMDELYDLDKELIYTGDYNMMGSSPAPPVQGGFLVIRPSMTTFEEFRAVIREGDFGHLGWGKTRIGVFWGGQTIQGILPYFYFARHPGKALELNRCEYNCMVDNPYMKDTTNCLDRKPTCQDCRLQSFDKVSSAHFTLCQKPWGCTAHVNPKNGELCQRFHDEWFKIRDEFEKENQLDLSYRVEQSKYVNSMGMCSDYGDHKYLPIPVILPKQIEA